MVSYEEKFEEVFGFPPDKDHIRKVCDLMNCNCTCSICKYHGAKWEDEYEEVKKEKSV